MIMGEWKHGRSFIKAVIQQTLKVKTIDEITEIIKLGFECVKTNLSLSYVLSYLVYASEFNVDRLVLEQLPGNSIYVNGVWVFKVDFGKTELLFEKLKFD